MECPFCGGGIIIKHGKRKTKSGQRQIYLCKGCISTFSLNPIKNITADPKLVLKALSIYNQGYSLQQTSNMLEQIYGERVPRNTIHYWIKRYQETFTYLHIRDRNERKMQIIHRNIQNKIFRLHLKKLERVKAEHEILFRFLHRIARGIEKPKTDARPVWELIKEENSALLDRRMFIDRTENRIASILKDEQKSEITRSILINDGITVCENLPISASESKDLYFSGSIDLLQIEGVKVTILLHSAGEQNEVLLLKKLLGLAGCLKAKMGRKGRDIWIGAFDESSTWLIPLK
ncbi:MAG: transposase [Thermoplasmatota archaeon]